MKTVKAIRHFQNTFDNKDSKKSIKIKIKQKKFDHYNRLNEKLYQNKLVQGQKYMERPIISRDFLDSQ